MNRFLTQFLLLLLFITTAHAQSGPGGIGLIQGKSSLQLWLDGENYTGGDSVHFPGGQGIKVLILRDRSENRKAAFPMDSLNKPLLIRSDQVFNGLASINFLTEVKSNSISGLMVDSLIKYPNLTIYCVLQTPALTAKKKTNGTILKYQQYVSPENATSDTSFLQDFQLTLHNNHFVWKASDVKTKKNYETMLPFLPGNSYLVRATTMASNGLLEIVLNDGKSNKIITSQQVYNSPSRLFIGSENLKATTFQGKIAALIIFSEALTTAERTVVENYLSSKYNLPLAGSDQFAFDTPENGNHDFEVAGIGKANDGSYVSASGGEGIFTITNPSDMDVNEYLFWGRDDTLINTFDSTDIPAGTSFRWSTQWRAGESGDVGTVDFLVDTTTVRLPRHYKLFLLIDKNGNERFSDDTVLFFHQNASARFLVARNISINNGDRFTLGAVKDMAQWTSALITPDGDGREDSYYVQKRGMVIIRDQNGYLVRELKAPGYWDGRNNDGVLAPPGTYVLEINEDERINIFVSY